MNPTSVDFGTISAAPTGGRLEKTVTYSISADEILRYAYERADGGAPNGSTQFSVGGGNCYSLFPPPPLTPASCTIVIEFDYSRSARGPSTGGLVIDADADFSTTADQLTVPLRANVSGTQSRGGIKKRKCRKPRRRHGAASAAKAKKGCGKKRR